MCGIAAIFSYATNAPPVEHEELYRIREAMAVRGPDGAGLWVSANKRVGLAHRRLSIIDLTDAGSQPMATDDDELLIIFNGEIYNYRTLRIRLEEKGHKFNSSSDTEVLLYLYREKGQEMVHDLRGMYAFAIWDQVKQGLFLARDPFGIKPLYYSDDGRVLRVASQVKALLKGGNVDTTASPAGYVGFFLWGYVPEPFTLYKGIRALPAGSIIWADNNGCQGPKRFFNLCDTLTQRTKNLQLSSKSAVKDKLLPALVDTVRHHLVSDVPVGVFLSSGLDSTTLTALAAEQVTGTLHTVTLGFKEYKDTTIDEAPLAELVARRYKSHHQTRWISKKEFKADFGRLLEAMDQPSVDGINTYFVSRVTAETGLKVAISGIGGDELFGGYPSFIQIPLLANTVRLFPCGSSLGKGLRLISSPVLRHFTSPKYAGLLEYGGNYGGAYLLRRGLFMPWELPDFLDGEVIREGWQSLEPLVRLEETINGINHDRLKVSALEMTWYMRNQLLRDADWAGMAHSLEIRVPLVDLKLLRSVASLLTLDNPPSKQDIAAFPTEPLPPEIVSRPKTGFSVPVQQWVRDEIGGNVGERGLRGWAKILIDKFGDLP